MKKFIVATLILIATNGYAQTDSTKSALSFTGYLEVYYA
jgi:hypothetical protein